MGGSLSEEFPLLSALGLYAADIRGDGNCLFNALSDQIYGDQSQHSTIRARVINYMREHAEYYKQFIDVHPGGGTRRNPKRKNAGAYSSPAAYLSPSADEINRVFESHLETMARGGTYGDNMEITAFAAAFQVDVKIYQRDFAYMVTTGAGGGDTTRPVAHIAYHMWEHYSSIRNLDGPHAGCPGVSPKVLSPEEEAQQKDRLAQSSPVQPWQIDVVHKSLPFLADKPTIKRALEAARGDINAAVSSLMDAEENGSTSSQQGSSSVEREQDSDDDIHSGPKKKQDRRMSRTTKIKPASGRHALSQVLDENSQESAESWDSETSSAHEGSVRSNPTRPTSYEEDSILKSRPEDATHSQPKRPILLKLHPPKPPVKGIARPISKSPVKGIARPIPKPHVKGIATPVPKVGSHGRISARDNKAMKKQAQKAARKERQQAAIKSDLPDARVETGLALRAKGMVDTPPSETFRTLFI